MHNYYTLPDDSIILTMNSQIEMLQQWWMGGNVAAVDSGVLNLHITQFQTPVFSSQIYSVSKQQETKLCDYK